MRINNIRRVIILGAIAIAGIIGTQSYWLFTSWGLNEEEFSQKAQLALYRVAKVLSVYNGADLPPRDIVRRRNNNTFVVNTESEIYGPTLEYLLQRELAQLALNIDFEYAIFDCTTDQLHYGGYCTYRADSNPTQPKATDFAKEDDFTYYFTVKFPTRANFILRNMQLVLFLSVILLLTVAFFVYSMNVILRQRRLAVLQKDFINNMTHEFKTPLATIRIAAGVFQREPWVQQDRRLSRYADIIHEQYERLNRQVEKVLQIAHIEEGRFELKKEVVNLQELIPPLLNSAQMRAEASGGQLNSQLPKEPLHLVADRLHFSNILYNLLDNALKYGGQQPQISITGQLTASTLALSISDSGPGIPTEHQEKVFEKFYRIPTGNVHNVKGFGLGLYYVREICQAHEWPIKIDSELGKGTTITIDLPLEPVSTPEVAELVD